MAVGGSNNRVIAVLVLLFAGIITLILLMGRNSPTSWMWFENYKPNSMQPYGTAMLYELLDSYTGGDINLVEDLNTFDFETQEGNWFYIGGYARMDAEKLVELIDFAERGNTVFLAASSWPDSLLQVMGSSYTVSEYLMKDTLNREIYLNFTGPPLEMTEDHRLEYWFFGNRVDHSWSYFDRFFLEYGLPEATILGESRDDEIFLVSSPAGEGRVVLLSIPLALTNYYINSPDGRDFAERILSTLDDGTIFWDAASEISAPPPEGQGSPLRFILSQPALRWSWYLILATVVLFLIFRTRRRQKAIQLVDAKENTTLEYVDTVSQLHYGHHSDHRVVAEMMRKHFLTSIRERYHLPTANLDEKFISQLSRNSGVEKQKVSQLVSRLKELDNEPEVSDYILQRIHRQILEFEEISQ